MRIFFTGGPICAVYIDDGIDKNQKIMWLFAFAMGKQAEYLTSLGSDEGITAALLKELYSMYQGQASALYLDAYVQNWTTDLFLSKEPISIAPSILTCCC